MANFISIVDPDSARRGQFVKAAEGQLAPVEGLQTGSCSQGDFCTLWAAAPCAPVSQVADGRGAAVLWGEAIPGSGPERLDASGLRQVWSVGRERSPAACDGFHAAIMYGADGCLQVGADLLGIFPVYYWGDGVVLLVGSSPELFRQHPLFRLQFNPHGLVGILLTNGLVEGQTLLKGVRRLGAGHLLQWRRGGTLEEVEQYKIPLTTRYFDLPFEAHVKILGEVLERAVSRHVPAGQRCGLMLSGGLDSRMLAGYLHEQGVQAAALTLGLPSDIEMRCARAVAHALHFDHHTANLEFHSYPRYGNMRVRWTHLANGFSSVVPWSVHPYLRALGPRVVVGHLGDSVVGGSHIAWAYSPRDGVMSFENFFSQINRWGIDQQSMRRLLRKDIFGDLGDEIIARIRNVYEGYSEHESRRAWCFDLYHRQRYHVGSAAWALSFGAWPVLPVVDREVVATAAAIPTSSMADRRLECELLCTRFPFLAELNLDRNSFDYQPLRPRFRHLLARNLRSRFWATLGMLGVRCGTLRKELRYYHRIHDFNSPGWVAVRQQAEPYRERVAHLFNKEVLDELLPRSDVPFRCKDTIRDSSGPKALLGFILWWRDWF